MMLERIGSMSAACACGKQEYGGPLRLPDVRRCKPLHCFILGVVEGVA